jgi:mRNA-degrading endonuclease toxin of MazEF toxin-antitoxin module
MSPLKRGKVIDVNLDPTQGSETGKVRPGVVVTTNVLTGYLSKFFSGRCAAINRNSGIRFRRL